MQLRIEQEFEEYIGTYAEPTEFVERTPGAMHYFVDNREVSEDEFYAVKAGAWPNSLVFCSRHP